ARRRGDRPGGRAQPPRGLRAVHAAGADRAVAPLPASRLLARRQDGRAARGAACGPLQRRRSRAVSVGEATHVEAGAALEVFSWDRTTVTRPQAHVTARSVDDVVAVMADRERYPSPVRPRGSGHSPANCGEADGGPIVEM